MAILLSMVTCWGFSLVDYASPLCRCNDYVKAWKRLTVRHAPNILTIALKRFQVCVVASCSTMQIWFYNVQCGHLSWISNLFRWFPWALHIQVIMNVSHRLWKVANFDFNLKYIFEFWQIFIRRYREQGMLVLTLFSSRQNFKWFS